MEIKKIIISVYFIIFNLSVQISANNIEITNIQDFRMIKAQINTNHVLDQYSKILNYLKFTNKKGIWSCLKKPYEFFEHSYYSSKMNGDDMVVINKYNQFALYYDNIFPSWLVRKLLTSNKIAIVINDYPYETVSIIGNNIDVGLIKSRNKYLIIDIALIQE